MDPGATLLTMELCGCLTVHRVDGLRTTMAIGSGWTPGVGLGWMMRLGDLHRSTMAVGRLWAASGVGCLVLWRCARCTHRRWWLGWAAEPLEAEWPGLRSGLAKFLCPLI